MNDATETARSVEAERPPSGGVVQHATEPEAVVRAVTVIMSTVVGLTFLFGFGNVLNLALRLGVPAWVAPLVAPAVDLSIFGLLLGTRHLALTGASADVLRPARKLLIFASVVTLALNVAEPLVAGEYGKAAFDAVGPLLLIGWSEVGPGLLQAISTTSSLTVTHEVDKPGAQLSADTDDGDVREQCPCKPAVRRSGRQVARGCSPEVLLERARKEDRAHRATHQKPISADTLRVRLGIGTAKARRLVKTIRSEFDAQVMANTVEGDVLQEADAVAANLAA